MGLVIYEKTGWRYKWRELIRRYLPRLMASGTGVDDDSMADDSDTSNASHRHAAAGVRHLEGVPVSVVQRLQPTGEDGNDGTAPENPGSDRPVEEIEAGLETRRRRCRAHLSDTMRIEIARADILDRMLLLYDNTQEYRLHTYILDITFTGEKGADFEGLSREFFAAFWDSCFLKYFNGKKMLHPRVGSYPSSPSSETWQKLGVILSHGFVLVNYLPPSFSKACIYFLLSGREPAPRIILESFLSSLSENDVSSLTMAMNTNLSRTQFPDLLMTQLTLVLSHFHSTFNLTPSNMNTAVASIARNCLIESPYYALRNMRDGMTTAHQSLWSPPPSDNEICSLLNSYTPTAENVISRLQVEYEEDPYHVALETRVDDWFRRFIYKLSPNQLMTLLRFITSSDILNGDIEVSFDGSQNEMGMVHVATCGRQIIFSRHFLSYEALETYMLNIINNPNLWNTFDTL